jgi:hypothetical protein
LLVFHGFNVKNIGTSNEHPGFTEDNRLDVIVDLNFVLPEILASSARAHGIDGFRQSETNNGHTRIRELNILEEFIPAFADSIRSSKRCRVLFFGHASADGAGISNEAAKEKPEAEAKNEDLACSIDEEASARRATPWWQRETANGTTWSI